MAIATADLPVRVVYAELGALRPAHGSALLDRIHFGVVVAGRPFGPTALYIPPAIWVGYHMVRFRPFFGRHFYLAFHISESVKKVPDTFSFLKLGTFAINFASTSVRVNMTNVYLHICLFYKLFGRLTFKLRPVRVVCVERLYKEFGRALRIRRKSAHLTQQDLADRVGLNRTSITNIELGRQHIPLHFLYTLASAVGALPDHLLPAKEFALPEPEGTVLHARMNRELDKHEVDEPTKLWFKRVVSKTETENEGADHAPQTTRRKSPERS